MLDKDKNTGSVKISLFPYPNTSVASCHRALQIFGPSEIGSLLALSIIWKTAKMCHVVQHAYKNCHHHHHWELVIPCSEGFDDIHNRCNVASHQFVSTKYLPPGQGLCCVTCVKNK